MPRCPSSLEQPKEQVIAKMETLQIKRLNVVI
jgi:hypothetical protein